MQPRKCEIYSVVTIQICHPTIKYYTDINASFFSTNQKNLLPRQHNTAMNHEGRLTHSLTKRKTLSSFRVLTRNNVEQQGNENSPGLSCHVGSSESDRETRDGVDIPAMRSSSLEQREFCRQLKPAAEPTTL